MVTSVQRNTRDEPWWRNLFIRNADDDDGDFDDEDEDFDDEHVDDQNDDDGGGHVDNDGGDYEEHFD